MCICVTKCSFSLQSVINAREDMQQLLQTNRIVLDFLFDKSKMSRKTFDIWSLKLNLTHIFNTFKLSQEGQTH